MARCEKERLLVPFMWKIIAKCRSICSRQKRRKGNFAILYMRVRSSSSITRKEDKWAKIAVMHNEPRWISADLQGKLRSVVWRKDQRKKKNLFDETFQEFLFGQNETKLNLCLISQPVFSYICFHTNMCSHVLCFVFNSSVEHGMMPSSTCSPQIRTTLFIAHSEMFVQ